MLGQGSTFETKKNSVRQEVFLWLLRQLTKVKLKQAAQVSSVPLHDIIDTV